MEHRPPCGSCPVFHVGNTSIHTPTQQCAHLQQKYTVPVDRYSDPFLKSPNLAFILIFPTPLFFVSFFREIHVKLGDDQFCIIWFHWKEQTGGHLPRLKTYFSKRVISPQNRCSKNDWSSFPSQTSKYTVPYSDHFGTFVVYHIICASLSLQYYIEISSVLYWNISFHSSKK